MTDTELIIFNRGVKTGLKAASDLVASRKHYEHDRFESAHTVWDDETAHDALVRRNFAADIIRHLDEIDPDNINDRLFSVSQIDPEPVPEFNPYSDLGFEIDTGLAFQLCEFCGDWDDVKFKPDPYDADIYNDHTKRWICGNCELNHAGEI